MIYITAAAILEHGFNQQDTGIAYNVTVVLLIHTFVDSKVTDFSYYIMVVVVTQVNIFLEMPLRNVFLSNQWKKLSQQSTLHWVWALPPLPSP